MYERYVNGLTKRKLIDLYNILADGQEDSELFRVVEERLDYIKKVDRDRVTFSSDRMVEHSLDDEARLMEMMNKYKVYDFPFLYDSCFSSANRCCVLLENGEILKPAGLTLAQFDEYFKNPTNIYNHEGAYNTLNMIKERYFLLGDRMLDELDEKVDSCRLQLVSISKYVQDIISGTKLKLSIGNTGITGTINGTYNHEHPYQTTMIETFAFASDLDKIQSGDYSQCKRLIFLPRSVRIK